MYYQTGVDGNLLLDRDGRPRTQVALETYAEIFAMADLPVKPCRQDFPNEKAYWAAWRAYLDTLDWIEDLRDEADFVVHEDSLYPGQPMGVMGPVGFGSEDIFVVAFTDEGERY